MPGKTLAAAIAAGTTLCITASTVQAKPDRSELKERIAARVENTVRQVAGAGDKNMKISAEDIHLKRLEPATVALQGQKISLYAVKAGIDTPDKTDAPAVRMVVDDSGRYQVAIKDLCTGRSAVQEARDRINRREIDPDLGLTIYKGPSHIVKTKKKTHELIFVSDPFCPYCRKAFDYFLNHKQLISEWRVVHMPYHENYGGDAAIWAVREGAGTVESMKLMQFAYGDLEPIKTGEPFEKKEKIIRQFMEEFPALEKKWGNAEQARYYLKGKYEDQTQKKAKKVRDLDVKATPGVFIDGVRVRGWDPARYDNLLGIDSRENRSANKDNCP